MAEVLVGGLVGGDQVGVEGGEAPHKPEAQEGVDGAHDGRGVVPQRGAPRPPVLLGSQHQVGH